jgi:hypothetical protein
LKREAQNPKRKPQHNDAEDKVKRQQRRSGHRLWVR